MHGDEIGDVNTNDTTVYQLLLFYFQHYNLKKEWGDFLLFDVACGSLKREPFCQTDAKI